MGRVSPNQSFSKTSGANENAEKADYSRLGRTTAGVEINEIFRGDDRWRLVSSFGARVVFRVTEVTDSRDRPRVVVSTRVS